MHSYRFVIAAGLLMLSATARAGADEAPGDRLGVDFDQRHPVSVGRITPASPRAYFVKNVSDAAACPADSEVCRLKAYLIPGNLALLAKTFGTYTCAVYESADAQKVRWTGGWLPSASLAPVTRAPALARADWIGEWIHASGHITIASAADDRLAIKGEAFYDAAQNVHTGVIDAVAKPAQGLLAFADDGSIAFDNPKAECLVRMQRIDALLVVEDNNDCGGIMVTFTGFYRRK